MRNPVHDQQLSVCAVRQARRLGIFLLTISGLALWIWGCHADANDPVGQGKELKDPVRRTYALGNLRRLYGAALADHKGDRSNPEVKKVADAIYEALMNTYIEHPEDTQNGRGILELLQDMRDPRTLPALLKGLEWRAEVTEQHAVIAASTIEVLDVPADKKGQVIQALTQSLSRVRGSRAIDNRLRVVMIKALGHLEDARAVPVLSEIATAQSEAQNFLINRLAAQQLGYIRSAAAVPAMITALFLFAPQNPAMRMNDVAAEALVSIGRPAYNPLIEVLQGKNAQVKKIVEQYIEAIRQRDAAAAKGITAVQIMASEATYTLGKLGFRDALPAILEETKTDDVSRRVNAALALVNLNLQPADVSQVRETLVKVFGDVPASDIEGLRARAQLISAMQHLYDSEVLGFILSQAKDSNLHPDLRITAASAYALLGDKDEAKAMRDLIKAEPPSEEGGFRENFAQTVPALTVAEECDKDLACWRKKLGDKDELVVRKAATMLGRFGRGRSDIVKDLVAKLDHPKLEVRLAAASAIDRLAEKGSPEAVQKIEQLRESEQGTAIWNQFSREALSVQARLRARTSS